MVYRHMVRHRLVEMMRSGLPRSVDCLGETRFEQAAERYLASGGPRSRFIREVVNEMAAHALPTWQDDPELPAHATTLVRFESLKWTVASLPSPEPGALRELDFEAPAVFNPTVRAMSAWYRVDKLQSDPGLPRLEQEHTLLLYRRRGQLRVSTYVLNEIGGRLYRAWSEPARSCADGVRAVLSQLEREPDARFIEGMAGVLADLVTHGIVLGSPVD